MASCVLVTHPSVSGSSSTMPSTRTEYFGYKEKEIRLVVIGGHYSIACLCSNPRGPSRCAGLVAVLGGRRFARYQVDRDGSTTRFLLPGLHVTFSFMP
ncbi:hypothetical protein SCLCIDRAFT_404134 [Scleroderma citrinum Foug A]|uniref:Uncharacterized protein n=1 Tax=Scleroderma citrinum Foug A TaxID=1036808 RepID=A0A0C2YWG5_9AGAM|nr:hypothetical protein SCLCIDRAFT_404134 [Scleroderma citrinum Foug A]